MKTFKYIGLENERQVEKKRETNVDKKNKIKGETNKIIG